MLEDPNVVEQSGARYVLAEDQEQVDKMLDLREYAELMAALLRERAWLMSKIGKLAVTYVNIGSSMARNSFPTEVRCKGARPPMARTTCMPERSL